MALQLQRQQIVRLPDVILCLTSHMRPGSLFGDTFGIAGSLTLCRIEQVKRSAWQCEQVRV